jgi:8-oxo-dGTP pyrophosphatase MutT (NUDIX family)
VRRWVWEVPAGAIGDETPLAAARRELAEEIGGHCRELRPVGRFYSSTAHLTLAAHVFLALDVELARHERERPSCSNSSSCPPTKPSPAPAAARSTKARARWPS